MTDSGAASSSGQLFDRRAVIVVVVAALVLVAAVGFVVGADVTERRHALGGWHSGVAHVGSRVATIQHDGWAYGAEDSVETWIDASGGRHDAGWPDCFRRQSGDPLVRDVPVRFAAHEVTLDGVTWRPILAIDCRG